MPIWIGFHPCGLEAPYPSAYRPLESCSLPSMDAVLVTTLAACEKTQPPNLLPARKRLGKLGVARAGRTPPPGSSHFALRSQAQRFPAARRDE
jgi:hypothetical protein